MTLFAAGCGSSRVVREGSQSRSVIASVPRPGATAVVARGDTLYRIGSRTGISMRDLAAWNGIAPPYTIYPGQT
ncbi:MAG: LysM peptidoglycan-binding domain-containing protein, partial [Pseudomonadota bacterium]|nr:LysM peptidoglycan-binding domain-containing protein [Pseudomonadota bacterium]